jgi:DNA mismatch endonuclease (patch repair protein)
MRSNRPVDTKPEVRLRSALHRAGMRFRKNTTVRVGDVVTRPDIIFPGARVVVFVDGCFWHQCPEHATYPKSNAGYWLPKLEQNRARDRQATDALTKDGWRVVRVWEHVPTEEAVELVMVAVRDGRAA